MAPTIFQRYKALKISLDASILISVGAEPEQALLRDPRSIEFDSQDGLGGALCLGGLAEDRIGR